MADGCATELKDAVQCKESAAFPNFRRAASHRDPLLPLFPYLPLGSLPFLLSHTFSLFYAPFACQTIFFRVDFFVCRNRICYLEQ